VGLKPWSAASRPVNLDVRPLAHQMSMSCTIRSASILLCFLSNGCGPHIGGADPNTYDRTVLLECSSPDGRVVATYYQESGGGAAGWAYQYLAVRDAAQPFDPSMPIFATSHGGPVRITWQDSSTLLIEYSSTASVLRSDGTVATPAGIIRCSYARLQPGDTPTTDEASGCGTAGSNRHERNPDQGPN
jgi:hypothetical protein